MDDHAPYTPQCAVPVRRGVSVESRLGSGIWTEQRLELSVLTIDAWTCCVASVNGERTSAFNKRQTWRPCAAAGRAAARRA
eukprot:6708595-Prymnesium_polylepis.1